MSDCIIETKGLTKRYGEQVSVSSLDLHVQKGRIYGLLGRNGAGKTTTMKMLLGLTAPTSGTVTIFGRPLKGNEKRVLPRIGSLIESPGFYPNLTGHRKSADLRPAPGPQESQLYQRGAGAGEPALPGQETLRPVLPGHETAAGHRPGGDARPGAADPGRAHQRPGPHRHRRGAGLHPGAVRRTGKTILLSSHILSEIALLADDIGIIDHGVLLEEESLAELEQKNGKVLRFTVSNAPVAAQLLQQEMGVRAVSCGEWAGTDRPGSPPGHRRGGAAVRGGGAGGVRRPPLRGHPGGLLQAHHRG